MVKFVSMEFLSTTNYRELLQEAVIMGFDFCRGSTRLIGGIRLREDEGVVFRGTL